jgi:hypothetical protein
LATFASWLTLLDTVAAAERALAELGVSVPRLLVESALSRVESSTDRRAMIAELFEVRRSVGAERSAGGGRGQVQPGPPPA